MKTIELMLSRHPRARNIPAGIYAAALHALAACEQACVSCADACLGEPNHQTGLARCIRTDLDCAEVCAATGRLLARHTESNGDLVHAQLHACVLACRICGDECASHASRHDHCATCAEACRACQEACNRLLGEIAGSGVVAGETDEADAPGA